MSTSRTGGRLRTTIAVPADQSSAPLMIPPRYESITVGAIPGAGGTLRVEFTLDDVELVESDPGSVQWYVWDDGFVGTPTARVLDGSITGVRGTAVTEDGVLDVVARFDR